MRDGSSIAATKARAVNCPTPGIVISRRQAAEALVIRLISASIAATAVITAVRAALNPRMATERPAIPSLALRAWWMKAAVSARGSRIPNATARPLIWFSKVTRWPTSFLARADQRAERMSLQRLHMHGLEEAGASQMRQTSRVVAIGLVGRKRLERMVGLPALHADHGQTEVAQPVKQDWRHSPSLEHDATDRLGRRCRLALANYHAFAIENANMRLVQKYRGQQNSPSFGLLFHILPDRIGLRRRAPDHYPMLKNSEIEVPRKSHLSAYSFVYVGSCHSNAY